MKQLFIIIRSIGERTTGLCAMKAARVFDGAEVVVMEEKEPLERKMERMMETALRRGAAWTLVLDADVVLRSNAGGWVLEKMRRVPGGVYNVEALVLDKFVPTQFGARFAGNHLYHTAAFEKALEFIPDPGVEVRPETYVKKRMAEWGRPTMLTGDVIGVHDFFQNYSDIFWKNRLQVWKHKGRLEMLSKYWESWARADRDYEVALEGMRAGLRAQAGGVGFVEGEKDNRPVNAILNRLKLTEKESICVDEIPAYERRVTELMAVADWYDTNLKKYKK